MLLASMNRVLQEEQHSSEGLTTMDGLWVLQVMHFLALIIHLYTWPLGCDKKTTLN